MSSRVRVLFGIGVVVLFAVVIIAVALILTTFGDGPKFDPTSNPADPNDPVGNGKLKVSIKNACPFDVWPNIESDGTPQFKFVRLASGATQDYRIDDLWEGVVSANYEQPGKDYAETRNVIDIKSSPTLETPNITYSGDYSLWTAVPSTIYGEECHPPGSENCMQCEPSNLPIKVSDVIQDCPSVNGLKLISRDGKKCLSPYAVCSDQNNFTNIDWCRGFFTNAIDYCASTRDSSGSLVYPHCSSALHPDAGMSVANSLNVFGCVSDPNSQDPRRNIPFANNRTFSGAPPPNQSPVPPDQQGGSYLCAALQRGVIDKPDPTEFEFYSDVNYPSNPYAKWLHKDIESKNVLAFPFDTISANGKGKSINTGRCRTDHLRVILCPSG